MENTRITNPVSNGFFQIIACAIALIVITNLLPLYFKTWFVESTGNIVMAPFFGFILSVGILLRSRTAHIGAVGLLIILAIASLIMLGSHSEKPGYWLVGVLSTATACLLVFSKNLKEYIR